jgi:hypothetical protein
VRRGKAAPHTQTVNPFSAWPKHASTCVIKYSIMKNMQIMSIHGQADADEVAAALAAIACCLESAAAAEAFAPLYDDEAPEQSAWRVAAALEAQDLPAARQSAHSAWGAADRARREGRWSTGILGL